LAGRKLRTAVAKPVRDPSTPRERPLDGEGRPYLTLAQFVKRAKLVESGGEAKHRVRQGGIEVNGQAEVRPGRKLHQGDRVRIAGRELTVDLESTSELPE
jgi:ribosome-associated protein